MKKLSIISKPTQLNRLTFDDLYEEISSDWRLKAERLQERRWRQMKHALERDNQPSHRFRSSHKYLSNGH